MPRLREKVDSNRNFWSERNADHGLDERQASGFRDFGGCVKRPFDGRRGNSTGQVFSKEDGKAVFQIRIGSLVFRGVVIQHEMVATYCKKYAYMIFYKISYCFGPLGCAPHKIHIIQGIILNDDFYYPAKYQRA